MKKVLFILALSLGFGMATPVFAGCEICNDGGACCRTGCCSAVPTCGGSPPSPRGFDEVVSGVATIEPNGVFVKTSTLACEADGSCDLSYLQRNVILAAEKSCFSLRVNQVSALKTEIFTDAAGVIYHGTASFRCVSACPKGCHPTPLTAGGFCLCGGGDAPSDPTPDPCDRPAPPRYCR